MRDGSYDLEILGRAENTEPEEHIVTIAAVLYDSGGRPLGIIYTYTDSIEPGQKIGFETSAFSFPPNVTLDRVASHTVYAYPFFQMQW